MLALHSLAIAQTSTGDAPAAPTGPLLRLRLDRQLTERVAPGQQPGGTTFARARKIEGTIDDRIVLEGDAEIRREGSVVRGDRITYTQATDEVNVEGHARIFREGAVFAGPRLDFKIEAQTGAMPNANFSYAPRQGRGDASLIEFLGNQQARMTQARFTTCAPGDDAWWIQAERIEIDGLEESATASTAKLYFQGIPIFASPIFGFPVGDRRRSGFLTPSLGLSSTLGTDIRIPYYWNIAPNYDYTIAPRVMSKRGVLFENELRFLEPTMRGTLVYNTIPNDRELDRSREQTSIRYEYSSPSGFAGGINYNRVSDDNFFVDFSESILGSSNKVLPQDAFLAYNQAYWNAAVRVTKNQTLQDPLAPITPPYERLPQAALNGYIADWRGFEASALLDGTRFDHATLESGDRYVADIRVAYPWTAPGWFVIPRGRFVSRAYSLDPTLHPGDSSPTVTTPMLSLDSGLVFERNTTWFGRPSQQTLEPRIYYAYIPYKNQSDLPNFDSAQVDLNYVQLFNENIYSGYDRDRRGQQPDARARHADPGQRNRRRASARGDRTALLLRIATRDAAGRASADGRLDGRARRRDRTAGHVLGHRHGGAVQHRTEPVRARNRRRALAAAPRVRDQCLLPVPEGRHRPDRRRHAVAALRPLVRGGPGQLLHPGQPRGRCSGRLRIQGRLLDSPVRGAALRDDNGPGHDQRLCPTGTERSDECRNERHETIAA